MLIEISFSPWPRSSACCCRWNTVGFNLCTGPPQNEKWIFGTTFCVLSVLPSTLNRKIYLSSVQLCKHSILRNEKYIWSLSYRPDFEAMIWCACAPMQCFHGPWGAKNFIFASSDVRYFSQRLLAPWKQLRESFESSLCSAERSTLLKHAKHTG